MTIGIYKMSARDAMTRGAETIGRTNSIHDALETMVNLGLTALPVVDEENRCVGVLTKTDIVKLAGALDEEEMTRGGRDLAALYFGVPIDELTKAKVEDVMTKHVISVTPDESLTNVAKTMLRHEIHHVPVCDEENKTVGMISSMDMVNAI